MSWIRTFGPGRRVARLSLEPSAALELVEVQTVGEGSDITNLFHLEEESAFQLYAELGVCLQKLWPGRFAADGATWEIAYAETSKGRVWMPISGRTGQRLEGFIPTDDRGAAERRVAELNAEASRRSEAGG